MNVNLLIDNIVRQTTILVAQLATAAGGRAPLAHVAAQVFVELVRELKSQGLGNKVIADMFGLTLRTYHDRVRRASESKTERGQSLGDAVLAHVRSRSIVTRASDAEAGLANAGQSEAAEASLVWVLLHQSGPLGVKELCDQLSLTEDRIQRALDSARPARPRTGGRGDRRLQGRSMRDPCLLPGLSIAPDGEPCALVSALCEE